MIYELRPTGRIDGIAVDVCDVVLCDGCGDRLVVVDSGPRWVASDLGWTCGDEDACPRCARGGVQ